jgi:hypothetical protein
VFWNAVLSNDIWEREHASDAHDVDQPKYFESVRAWLVGALFVITVTAWATKALAGDAAGGLYLLIAVITATITNLIFGLLSEWKHSENFAILCLLAMALTFGVIAGAVGSVFSSLAVVKVFIMLLAAMLALALLQGGLTLIISRKVELVLSSAVLLIGGIFAMKLPLMAWIGLLFFAAVIYHGLQRSERLPYTRQNAVASASATIMGFIPLWWFGGHSHKRK